MMLLLLCLGAAEGYTQYTGGGGGYTQFQGQLGYPGDVRIEAAWPGEAVGFLSWPLSLPEEKASSQAVRMAWGLLSGVS